MCQSDRRSPSATSRWTPVALLLLAAPLVAQPVIDITTVPPFGTVGAISGRAAGVDFATHRVAVYIHIEGSGWWTKPSFQAPTVAIRPDGTWTASVVSTTLDSRATIYCAALLAPGVAAPLASGAIRVPASLQALAVDVHERYGRVVSFAGLDWAVKDAPSPVGPGGNPFSSDPRDVQVDAQGRLHLAVVYRNGVWTSAEVMSVDHLGYGTFWFTTESELEDLDPNLTFGAFTWDPYGDDPTIPRWPNREIDFEDSRWGQPGDPTTSQVVVQPYDVPGNLLRFTLPDLAAAPTVTRALTWQPDRVEFLAARGRHAPCSIPAAAVLHRSTYLHQPTLGHIVPSRGRTRFHFNLWINRGGAPRDGQRSEVIISGFRHTPVVGTFVGGCGINPEGSLRATVGSTSLGRTFLVAIDNPVGSQPAGSLAALLLGFRPDAAYPCGSPIPGWGMSGPIGELQVDPAPGLVTLSSGLVWNGPGALVQVPVSIPMQPSLAGLAAYAQGLLLDRSPQATHPLTITDAMQICIRP
ncbi:MAG: hypothetical protein IPM29_13200 [Planctomycetes bacterium]|nr:hypothetical protein [Planctomycetota bacterium]